MTVDISVIVPVRNGAALLGEALASAMNQSVAPMEVIVVDDGSTENIADVAHAAGAVYVKQEALGQAAARNAGVASSRGDFIGFLDADDMWPPEKLAIQAEAIRRDPSLDAVFGHAIEFRECNAGQPIPLSAPVPAHLPGAMLVSRAAFARTGPYRSDWRVGEVLDWYARAIDLGLKMVTLPETVLWRRIHNDNLGRRTKMPEVDYLSVVRGIIARRRGT